MNPLFLLLLSIGLLLASPACDSLADYSENTDTEMDDTDEDGTSTETDQNTDENATGTNSSLIVQKILVQPPAPSCTVSLTDDEASSIEVDLAAATSVTAPIIVKNTLPASHPSSNISANEESGIMLESYILSFSSSWNLPEISSQQITYNYYIQPGGAVPLFLTVVPNDVLQSFRNAYNCEAVNYTAFTQQMAAEVAETGTYTGTIPMNQMGQSRMPLTSEIVLQGQAMSGASVSSTPFAVNLMLYCGPSDSFDPCVSLPCEALCAEPITPQCVSGVMEQPQCASVLANASLCASVCD